MNNVYLCVGSYAQKSFYLEAVNIHIYSMEELCYYFIEKVYLLDNDIMQPELVEWIKEECKMKELAKELDILVRKRTSAALFVTTILETVGLYNKETVSKVNRILKEEADMPPYERKLKRAGYYFKAGRYHQALHIYTELLAGLQETERDKKAALYYNIASVYAMDFAYGQAARYYYDAYQLNGDERARQAYIAANKMNMSDEAYIAFAREHAEWEGDFRKVRKLWEIIDDAWLSSKEREVLLELMQTKNAGETAKYYDKTGEIMKQMKLDYRKQMI